MDRDTTVRRSDRAVCRRLADKQGAVVLHLDTAAYHGVNEFGALVWDRLAQEQTCGQLLTGLRQELDAPPPGWEGEVVAFLAALAERDLVTTAARR